MNEEKVVENFDQSTSCPSAAVSSGESVPDTHSASALSVKAKELRNDMNSSKEYFQNLRNELKDQKSLNRSHYGDIKESMPKTFILQNKKTGKVAEIKACSELHAANLIGWRLRHVIVLETKLCNIVEYGADFETASIDKVNSSKETCQ